MSEEDQLKPLVNNNDGGGDNGGGGSFAYSQQRQRHPSTKLGCQTARAVLATRPSGVLGGGDATERGADQKLIRKANIQGGIVFPFTSAYRTWWFATAIGACLTVFLGPYQIAFGGEPGFLNDAAWTLEILMDWIFAIDIVINFNLAFYLNEIMVFERARIFRHYASRMFWVDLVGVFPFESVAFAVLLGRGDDEESAATNDRTVLLLSLLRLFRFVRLHRLKKLSDLLQYNARVSLLWFTILRNFAAVLCTSHWAACCMYFIARLHDFDPDQTWIGPRVQGATGFQRYVTSLYWSIVTFCTVGYGDYAPVSTAEQICGIVFMLFNIVVAAWIIGSITLLVVKGDEKTGDYRDTLQTLHQYSRMHQFDPAFERGLKTQLRLEFHNREISDEQVLKNFPGAVRRKVLRRLYLQPLVNTHLMLGIRQQFVDAFLAACTVEIFSPGEVIVERGSILSDLFLLVGGIAEITTLHPCNLGTTPAGGGDEDKDTDKDLDLDHTEENLGNRKLEAGDFVGEIGFFTESPQVDSVACLTVCKTLTMSQSSYKLLAQDHPGSVGKILNNLLEKVEDLQLQIPKNLSILRAGSVYDPEAGYGSTMDDFVVEDDIFEEIERRQEALTSIKDLVKMHMSKQLDDQTTRFCFAASRGDTSTIALMCDQGFDPNNADYDTRTALMVASMKGNTDVVRMLLEYKASPNMTDMHGSTALLEAAKNGHETTMHLLFEYGAELCMKESLAASVICQAVYDGDILLLRRLLRAGIQVNAADYDKRTAAHIAAAEGNVAAIRVLAEHGADLTVEDRWKNTVQKEAERSNARQLLDYLKSNKKK